MTTVLGLVFDDQARMYVLEMSELNGGPAPFTGKVLRVNPSGTVDTIATGLNFPTGMLDPDGNLYVSDTGFAFPPGAGQVLRINLNN